jgi:hypothetical protein
MASLPTPTIPEGLSMDKVVSILKKKNKTLAELQILDKRFKTVKFFSESREKIDLDNFYK